MKTNTGRKCLNEANARFWTWANNAWVKLTLQPGQTLAHVTFAHTDEGSSWTVDVFSHTGPEVLNNWARGGTDCDGPIRTDGVSSAAIDELAAVPASCGPVHSQDDMHAGRLIFRPEWRQSGGNVVTDAYAQAAGY